MTSLATMGNACCCRSTAAGRYSVAEAEETRRLQLELWERTAAKSATATEGADANGDATAVMGMGRSASGE